MKYIELWENNMGQLYQRDRKTFDNFLTWLKAKKIIRISVSEEAELKIKFYNKKIPTLNICPGFGANL